MTLPLRSHDLDGAADGHARLLDGRTRGLGRVRVFLVDDHQVVRYGLRALLAAEADLEAVGEAADVLAAARLLPAARPDVVLLDQAARAVFAAAAAALAREYPAARVLAVSAHEHPGDVRQALAAGAAGYVLKRSAPADVVRAVRAVAGGGTYLDPAVAGGLLHDGADGAAELSDRESEVVRLIARGYSNKEIAARLALSVKTVETYKARSLEKLGVRSRVGLVQFAAGRGWLDGAAAMADGHAR